MTKLNQIYKCNVCGNIVEVLHTGAGELVCCGEPMELQEPKTKDEGLEKHVPVIEAMEEGQVKVKIGSVPHPMEEEHHIEWVELNVNGQRCKKFLNAGDAPEAIFEVPKDTDTSSLSTREYCNVHRLWQTEK